MNRFLPLCLAAALAGPVMAAGTAPRMESKLQQQADSYRARTLAKAPSQFMAEGRASKGAVPFKAPGTAPVPEFSFAGVDDFSRLLGPDGSEYFYTADLDIEYIEHEYYTEELINGFTYRFYDDKFQYIGTVSDRVHYTGDRVRLVRSEIGVNLTRKFFNYDENIEILVTQVYNTETPGVNETVSVAYSINGETDSEGNSVVVAEIEGIPVDAVNAAQDQWSENFYMTFANDVMLELSPEDIQELGGYEWLAFIEGYAMQLDTYKKASYAGGPQKVNTEIIQYAHLPGDQQATPCMMSFARGGRAYFVFQKYDKRFLDDPAGFIPSDEVTPDNRLLIDIYSIGGWDSEFKEVQHTAVPTVQEEFDGLLCVFYGLGDLDYENDILWNGTDYDFVIAREKYTVASDEKTVNSYYVYDAGGNRQHTLIEDVDGFVALSDIPGQERQFMFICGEVAPSLEFINIPSGEYVTYLDCTQPDHLLTASVDRVATSDGGYIYAFRDGYAYDDGQGNNIEKVVYVDTEGEIVRVDELNTGANVAYAMVYIHQDTLNPYYFNTDSEREYMYLVKRYIGGDESTLTQEELMILATDGRTVMHLLPDAEKGNLRTITPAGNGAGAKLQVAYADDNRQYTIDFYDLPFERFAGGDGTAENPYLVATPGDLLQLSADPAGHYRLVNDIDAGTVRFNTVEGQFTGELDGAGHTVSNLSMTTGSGYSGMFEYLGQNACIHDINFTNPSVEVCGASAAGLIAGMSQGGVLEHIAVKGLTVTGEGMFGSLIGNSSLGTSVTGCSVGAASIQLPESTVGGIVGSMRTGTVIKGCSFTGAITGGTEVGGIAGISNTGDELVSGCHVDADLTAKTTVGGILGFSKRSRTEYCYVEGAVRTLGNPAMRFDAGPAAGGIVGELTPDFGNNTDPEGNPVEPTVAINHCVVALESMTAHEPLFESRYRNEQNTMHRIVGHTKLNEMPEIKDYDEEGNPVFGSSMGKEMYISDNYALSTLAPVDETLGDKDTTTEGKSVNPSELSQEWFAALGFAYGTTADMPWRDGSGADPAVWHETAVMLDTHALTAVQGNTFSVSAVFDSRLPLSVEEMTAHAGEVETSDPQTAVWNGVYTVKGNTLTYVFDALNEGNTTVSVCGIDVEVKVIPATPVGVQPLQPGPGARITLKAGILAAEGCAIEIYSTAGSKVASARSLYDVRTLQPGVYAAVATAADGSRSAVKFRR